MRKPLSFFVVIACFFFTAASAHAYDKPYVGEQKIYVADHEDTLVHIARHFELGFVEMRAANPYIDPWLPGAGTEIILPSKHLIPDAKRQGIVINLPEMRLYAFLKKGEPPVTFPLGIGREGLETPLGQTTVVRKKEGPTWRPTARMRREDPDLPAVVPPGPENPLGTHALYLGWPTYAIHGTDKPYGIGRRISSGCIRLYPENIKELFEIIPVGTKVTVVNQPIKVAWINDVLYLEAHPDMEQAIQMEESGSVYTGKMRNQDMQKILKAAGEHKELLHWAAIRNAIRDRTGVPIMIARKPGGEIKDDFKVVKADIEIDEVEGLEPIDDEGAETEEKEEEVDIEVSEPVEEEKVVDEDIAEEPKNEGEEVLSEIYDDEQEEETDNQAPAKIMRTLNP